MGGEIQNVSKVWGYTNDYNTEVLPPSTVICVPVIYAAAGDARKATAAAISSGLPNLRIGISASISESISSSFTSFLAALLLTIDFNRSVSVAPGKTLF